MNPFDRAISQGLTSIRSVASSSVTFRRGGFTVVVGAVQGSTDFETEDGEGMVIRFESVDFLIQADELILNSAVVEPQEGDEIDKVVGSTTLTYKVLMPAGGSVFSYSDSQRSTLRIHTKLVTEV